MHIQKVYTTSKGMFWNKRIAEQYENRVKRYTHPNQPVQYEPVLEAFVLVVKLGEDFQVFQMQAAVVK